MSVEKVVNVLATTLYSVSGYRVSVRRAFAKSCAEHGCSGLPVSREALFNLAKDFVSRYYELLCISEKSGRLNPSFKALARLYLYLYGGVWGIAAGSRVKKSTLRDFRSLTSALEKCVEPWAKLSYPRWLYEEVAELLPSGEAFKLLEGMNRRVYWVRVNTLKMDLDKALKALSEEGVVFEVVKEIPFLAKVTYAKKPLRLLKLFKEGVIVPQDKASVLVVLALKPEPGMFIYDYAAAPGVKASLIMQLTENRARLVAVDASPRRLEAMRELLKLYGVEGSRVIPVLADSTKISLEKQADVALVDAPCSSSGAVAKDPAIKVFLRSKEVVYGFKRVQVEMLYNALKHVPTVVYATCSILPEEGEEVVEEVLSRGVESRVVDAGIPASRGYAKYSVWNFVHRTMPHVDMCEGFFIARFEA